MKIKPILLVAVLLSGLSSGVFAQNSTATVTRDVVMREGIFWAEQAVDGKIYASGEWVDPTFDVNDPAAVAAAIASVSSLRADPSYGATISSLNLALGKDPLQDVTINNALKTEFVAALGTNAGSAARGADWSEVNLTGVNLMNRDLTGTNVTGTQLNAVSSISGTTLSGLDLTGWVPPADINRVRLTGATGLEGVDFSGVTNMNQVVLPEGIDMTGFSAAGKALCFVDFRGTNITGEQLNGAGNDDYGSLHGANFSGLDLTGWNTTGVYLHNANLTGVQGLTASNIAASKGINYLVLTGTGITREQLAAAIVGRTPTWNFDINTVVF